MPSPAEQLFHGLDTYAKVEELIKNGEAEGPYLECKSPRSPQMNSGLRSQLAEAVSGFSNSGGGVILWGVSTDSHLHSGLDVLTQIEPIGACRNFARQVDKQIPLLTAPSVTTILSTVLVRAKGDTKGIVVTYIPATPSDPVQALFDSKFYFRISDAFHEMPYEILKRMFLSTQGPDLSPVFAPALVNLDGGTWAIPIVLQNESSAVAEHTAVFVEFVNHDACESIEPVEFTDVSKINPGRCLYARAPHSVVHRGLNSLIGSFRVVMRKEKLPRRVLRLRIDIYASHMRAKRHYLTIQLAAKGPVVRSSKAEFLY